MSYLFKSNVITVLLILVSVVGCVQADYEDSFTCEEIMINGPVDCNYCSNEWIVSADFLYWRALQNGLECDCGPEIKDRWDFGYRIGLEYVFPCSDWDIAAYWTHLHNRTHQGDNDGDNAHWKLKYDAVDLLFGYECAKYSCLTYTPYIGLRGATIEEKLRADFDGCDCYDNSSISKYNLSYNDNRSCGSTNGCMTTEQNHKEKFWGIGPQLGINAWWNLGCGFSLNGNLGVGFLYGHFQVNVHDFQKIPYPTDNGKCCIRRNIHACQAFADFTVGLQWERYLCNNVGVILQFDLEHHRYFNQNHIGGYGDLCLDGITFSAGITF